MKMQIFDLDVVQWCQKSCSHEAGLIKQLSVWFQDWMQSYRGRGAGPTCLYRIPTVPCPGVVTRLSFTSHFDSWLTNIPWRCKSMPTPVQTASAHHVQAYGGIISQYWGKWVLTIAFLFEFFSEYLRSISRTMWKGEIKGKKNMKQSKKEGRREVNKNSF